MSSSNRSSESTFFNAELKKAFALFDRDANGSIDVEELSGLLGHLLEDTPTEQEVVQLMELMDADKNGSISLEEFIKAMTGWLGSDFTATDEGEAPSLTGTKRKRQTSEDERKQVHKKIKAFFLQFRFDYNHLGMIRGKMRTEQELFSAKTDALLEDDESDIFVENYRLQFDSKAKLQFLVDYRTTLGNIPTLCQGLETHLSGGVNANNAQNLYDVIKCVSDMLSIVSVFNTPLQRRAIADDIVKVYEFCVQYNLIQHWVKCLQYRNLPQLQFEAARALAFFAPGPRIASTPADSPLHPKNMFFKKIVVSEGCVVLLRALLESEVQEVVEQAVLALGGIAQFNAEARDYCLACEVLPRLLLLVNNDAPLTTVRKVVWTVSVLCGVGSRSRLPPWEAIHFSLEKQALVLFCDDEQAITTVCKSLAIMLPGVPELAVDRRLCELLRHSGESVQCAVLETIESIAQHDDTQLQVLMSECDLLAGLYHMLKSTKPKVRLAACGALCTIAERGHAQALFSAGILGYCIGLLRIDECVRFSVAKLLHLVTHISTPHQVRKIVDAGVVKELCASLVHFKVYDDVLIKLYRYTAPSFNFEFVRHVIATLEHIVNFGEMAADEQQTMNAYALLFDSECIDKMRSLLDDISKGGAHNIDAWRFRAEDAISVEERVQVLLFKVHRAHSINASSASSALVVEQIGELYAQFFEHLDTVEESRSFLLKCYMDDDIRVVEVPVGVTFDTLLEGLCEKYMCDAMYLSYEDEDFEFVTIDGDQSLENALRLHQQRGDKTLKVKVVPVDPSTVAPAFSPRSRRKMSTTSTSASATTSNSAAMGADGSLDKDILQSSLANAPQQHDLRWSSGTQQTMRVQTMRAGPQLSVADCGALVEQWKEQCDANGHVTRSSFESAMESVGVSDPLVVEQLFSAFDVDGDGLIDVKEFVNCVGVLAKGSDKEKLELIFNAYDTDGNGVLDRDEVFAIFKASVTYGGTDQQDADSIRKMVEECFAQYDENNDGELSFDEFTKAVMSNGIVATAFEQYPLPVLEGF